MKLKKTIVQEVEIEFPYFVKYYDWYLKAISKNEVWRLTIGDYSVISKGNFVSFSTDIENGTQITEDEFNQQWVLALNEILPKPVAEKQGKETDTIINH